jgi:hypothetical protein
MGDSWLMWLGRHLFVNPRGQASQALIRTTAKSSMRTVFCASAAASPFTAPPRSVTSDADRDLDECEVLLRRAIAMVRGPTPTRGSQATRSLTDGRPGAPAESTSSAPIHLAPAKSILALADSDLDECEALLRRAIAMVRGPTPTRGSQATGSLTDGRPGAPAESTSSAPIHLAPAKSILALADSDLDECEALLRRAIAMVRGPIGGSHGSPADLGPPKSILAWAEADWSNLDACEAVLNRTTEMLRSAARASSTGYSPEGGMSSAMTTRGRARHGVFAAALCSLCAAVERRWRGRGLRYRSPPRPPVAVAAGKLRPGGDRDAAPHRF